MGKLRLCEVKWFLKGNEVLSMMLKKIPVFHKSCSRGPKAKQKKKKKKRKEKSICPVSAVTITYKIQYYFCALQITLNAKLDSVCMNNISKNPFLESKSIFWNIMC